MNVHSYLQPLQDSFEEFSDAPSAAQMKAYMKGHFDYYGIKTPLRRTIEKEFVAQYGKPAAGEVGILMRELWLRPQRDWQLFGMDLLGKIQKLWPKDVLDLFEYMITNRSWWDTVDFIASTLVYKFYVKNPEAAIERIRRWSVSNNMWLNRTAIIFQLKCRDNTRTDLLEEFIVPHLGSKEFFHQKAIGWSLRQYGKFNPDWVIDFVDRHELKPLSRREALRLITS